VPCQGGGEGSTSTSDVPVIREQLSFPHVDFQVLTGTDALTKIDTNLNPQWPLHTDLSRADAFLLAVFVVGLIRSASMGSRRLETAINQASNPNSMPLAGLSSPNT